MEWTCELPTRAGYYWYLGPVLKRDFKKYLSGVDMRDCVHGPIIAGVGITLKEIPSNDGHEPHERMWKEGRIVVEFYGYTVSRTLAEMPKGVLWAGPIKPPISDWAWSLCSQNVRENLPYSAEMEASVITAFGKTWKEIEEKILWKRI